NTRVAMGEADLVLAGNLVVAASQESVARMRAGRTRLLLNSDVAPTAAFVQDPDWRLPGADLQADLRAACGEGGVDAVDAAALALGLLGDAIYANPLMLGYAYQKGWLPLGEAALRRAIELNGQQVASNLAAFAWGRRAAHDLAEVQRLAGRAAAPQDDGFVEVRRGQAGAAVLDMRRPAGEVDALVAVRSEFLTAYQNAAYAARYRELVEQVARAEQAATGTTRLAAAVARYYFKLMAYKDEYEVARLYTDGEFLRQVDAQFEGDWKLRLHLAPPLL